MTIAMLKGLSTCDMLYLHITYEDQQEQSKVRVLDIYQM